MINIIYHTVGTVANSNMTVVIKDKSIVLVHRYVTAHFPGLVEPLR